MTKRNGSPGHQNGSDLIMYAQTHCDVTNNFSPSTIFLASFPGQDIPRTRLKECDSKIASNFWHKLLGVPEVYFARFPVSIMSGAEAKRSISSGTSGTQGRHKHVSGDFS